MDTQATQVNTADGSAVQWIEPAPGEPAPMPLRGGAYIRMPDGTLVLEECTQDNPPGAVPAGRAQEA